MIDLSPKEKETSEDVEGKVIGIALQDYFDFIKEKEGREGLELVEKELKNLGVKVNSKNIKRFAWYPESYDELIAVTAQRIFNWPDDTLRLVGRWMAKTSLIRRIMVRYFVSVERVINEVQEYWRKFHLTGNLKVENYEPEKKELYVALEKFNPGRSAHCRIIEGYIHQIASYIVPPKNIKVKETECAFRGGRRHLYKVTW